MYLMSGMCKLQQGSGVRAQSYQRYKKLGSVRCIAFSSEMVQGSIAILKWKALCLAYPMAKNMMYEVIHNGTGAFSILGL